jgi:glycosyltransferase involved in cell wall biosynthesis
MASEDVAHLLPQSADRRPAGYLGAPLTAVLADALWRRGHEIFAITVDYSMERGAAPARFAGERFSLTVLPGRRRAWRPNGWLPGRALDLFRIEREAIAAEIVRSAPDIVHAHWAYEFALGALDSGLPHLVTVHDCPRAVFQHTHSPYRAVRWLMAREVMRRAEHLTAVSPYLVERIEPYCRVSPLVVPNPVAPYVFASGRDRRVPSGKSFAMVANGWGPLKNPASALEAFALFAQRHPDASFHAFGADFGRGGRAAAYLRARGIKGVRLHGALPHRELIRRLSRFDVLVHPSLEESFGVVIAEAMALGLPVIAGSRSGAVPWVMRADEDGFEAGYLVNVQSPNEIADAMERVVGREYPGRSRVARRLAYVRFSADSVADRYFEQYETSVARGVRTQGAGDQEGEQPIAAVTRACAGNDLLS